MFTLIVLLGVGAFIYHQTRKRTADQGIVHVHAKPGFQQTQPSLSQGQVARPASDMPGEAVVGRVVLTTGELLPGRRVTEILDVVTYQGVRSTSAWEQFLRGSNPRETLSQMRSTCLQGLRTEAALLGADAVICVRMDPFHTAGTLLMMSASGTAVRTAGSGRVATGAVVNPASLTIPV